MSAKKKFQQNAPERIIRDIDMAGQKLGKVTFLKKYARIKIVPTEEYPDAAPIRMLIRTAHAKTKYDVLRKMILLRLYARSL